MPVGFEPLDEQGWLAELMARHGRELRGYLARFAHGDADVDDWMQESLLRLYAASRDGDIREPRAYLFRIARNVALNRLEHRRMRSAVRFDVELAARARSETPPLHQLAQTGRDVQQLYDAIERLPARCREAFVLCKFYGFSHREIAAILEISVSTVEKHLVKGLRLCRAMLLGEAAGTTEHGDTTEAAEPQTGRPRKGKVPA